MTWIQTNSGLAFDLIEPKPEQVSLDDLAHSLAHQTRFTGHTRFYSVAEHCCHVAETVAAHTLRLAMFCSLRPFYRLAGLLHDAHEAYIGDISSPMKVALELVAPGFKDGLRILEERIANAICHSLPLPFGQMAGIAGLMRSPTVKRSDLAMLHAERNQLLGEPPRDWIDMPPPAPIEVQCWGPGRAAYEWRSRVDRLLVQLREVDG